MILEALTDKERRILVAYLDCERIKDTAEHLGLAPQTVKNHLHNIYAKLDTTNAIGAFKAMGWAKVPRTESCPCECPLAEWSPSGDEHGLTSVASASRHQGQTRAAQEQAARHLDLRHRTGLPPRRLAMPMVRGAWWSVGLPSRHAPFTGRQGYGGQPHRRPSHLPRLHPRSSVRSQGKGVPVIMPTLPWTEGLHRDRPTLTMRCDSSQTATTAAERSGRAVPLFRPQAGATGR